MSNAHFKQYNLANSLAVGKSGNKMKHFNNKRQKTAVDVVFRGQSVWQEESTSLHQMERTAIGHLAFSPCKDTVFAAISQKSGHIRTNSSLNSLISYLLLETTSKHTSKIRDSTN